MHKKYNIAVIGATGSVGRETLNSLSDRSFPVENLRVAASSDSIGAEVSFGNKILKVSSMADIDFAKTHIAFFCAGSLVAKQKALEATERGCVVIDKSSCFRMDEDVPLIVPEANLHDLKHYVKKNIIASPNCCAIPIAVVLKPLDNVAKIKRIVISTYQSVSGAGKHAMDELYNQTKAKYIFQDVNNNIFPKQIAFNLFPHIGDFNQDGSTTEESKISEELGKIFGSHVKSTVTCVRVPIFVSHSISVNVEFEKNINAQEVEEILRESDSILVISQGGDMKYISPVEAVGDDSVYVSRIRDDLSQKNAINMWIVSDNLRKGSALNAVQIAEELIKKYF